MESGFGPLFRFCLSLLLTLLVLSCYARGFLAPLIRSNHDKVISLTALSASGDKQTICRPSFYPRVPSQVKHVHLVVLVHGWMGNSLELGYLQKTLENSFISIQEEHPQDFLLVYSAVANEGRTHDGIAAGGHRLATEVNDIIQDLLKKGTGQQISISFVGNSLGGLYARWALSEINTLAVPERKTEDYAGEKAGYQNDSKSKSINKRVRPGVFYSIATPHLGVTEHTYLPLPRAAEYVISNALQSTGAGLFRYNNDIERMATDPKFLLTLKQFNKRVAYANAHATDFQVPTSTAAFLSEIDSVHRQLPIPPEKASFVSLIVETSPREIEISQKKASQLGSLTSADLAHSLDALGWVKVFCDVRSSLPSLQIPFLGRGQNNSDLKTKGKFSSEELYSMLGKGLLDNGRWHAPFGHTLLVANSKSELYARLNSAGQPVMDEVARSLIDDILSSR